MAENKIELKVAGLEEIGKRLEKIEGLLKDDQLGLRRDLKAAMEMAAHTNDLMAEMGVAWATNIISKRCADTGVEDPFLSAMSINMEGVDLAGLKAEIEACGRHVANNIFVSGE